MRGEPVLKRIERVRADLADDAGDVDRSNALALSRADGERRAIKMLDALIREMKEEGF
jgi:hypothetical protein